MRNEQPKYSRAVIERYRAMEQSDAFRREVREFAPIDLHMDHIVLSCGHEAKSNYHFLELLNGARAKPGPATMQCEHCKTEWLAEAMKEENV